MRVYAFGERRFTKGLALDILGVLALPVLVIAVGVFGALEPGYSHVHMSVSSLGAVAAANTLLMNLFGLFLPGILIGCAAFGFKESCSQTNNKFHAFYFLLVFGLMFAGLAYPLDAPPMYGAKVTVHYVLAYSTPWIYLTASVVTCAQVRGMNLFGVYKLLLFLLPVIFFIAGFIPKTLISPGLSQRVLLLCCLGWIAVLSMASIQIKIRNNLASTAPSGRRLAKW